MNESSPGANKKSQPVISYLDNQLKSKDGT